MSKANPKIGIDAILPTSKSVGGYTINQIKLGTMAILEQIDSPVSTGADMTLFNMLPTMYVMVHPYRDTLMAIDRDTFPETVMLWADTLADNVALELQNACLDEIKKVFLTAPKGKNESADPLEPDPQTAG